MPNSSIIQEYQEILGEIGNAEELVCLAQPDVCRICGKNPIEFLSTAEKTRQRLKRMGSVEWDWITLDLTGNASVDIVFSIKNAYLYRPNINSFRDLVSIEGRAFPLYLQTLEDKRYLYFCGVGLEKLYAFWDRIGDLMDLSFGLNISKRQLTFSKVIDELEKRNVHSNGLSWLKEFKGRDYKELTDMRHPVVHDRGLDNYFRKQYLIGLSGKEDLDYWENLQQAKERLVFFLKEQLKLTIVGFEKTILLIAEKEA